MLVRVGVSNTLVAALCEFFMLSLELFKLLRESVNMTVLALIAFLPLILLGN
jgi:hypothetical protein